jgi:hypothetical protein
MTWRIDRNAVAAREARGSNHPVTTSSGARSLAKRPGGGLPPHGGSYPQCRKTKRRSEGGHFGCRLKLAFFARALDRPAFFAMIARPRCWLAPFSARTFCHHNVLPPVEYDHPCKGGPLITTRPKDQAELRTLCKPSPLAVVLGCTGKFPTGCLIVIADDDTIRRAGWTTEIVIRHEVGHCSWVSSARNRLCSLSQPTSQFKQSLFGR